jgi:hypothetical protein
MKQPMADIAAAALDQELRTPASQIPDTHPLDVAEGPVAADVWIDGDLDTRDKARADRIPEELDITRGRRSRSAR